MEVRASSVPVDDTSFPGCDPVNFCPTPKGSLTHPQITRIFNPIEDRDTFTDGKRFTSAEFNVRTNAHLPWAKNSTTASVVL